MPVDPTSNDAALGWAWRASSMGSTDTIVELTVFFCFFILLTEAGIKTTSEKVSLAVTFDPRRLSKTPQIISFARLG